eukprot:TRINITY_DN838_c0_g1_i1.p1 TRINITY_DN838_c0_g1~~TRINITY_DN838_c0_g1_i1.p1  ORF type:complete len:181 (-),score=0.39 TRINITY_DN838_c0_g1_i1:126-668(-)
MQSTARIHKLIAFTYLALALRNPTMVASLHSELNDLLKIQPNSLYYGLTRLKHGKNIFVCNRVCWAIEIPIYMAVWPKQRLKDLTFEGVAQLLKLIHRDRVDYLSRAKQTARIAKTMLENVYDHRRKLYSTQDYAFVLSVLQKQTDVCERLALLLSQLKTYLNRNFSVTTHFPAIRIKIK